MFGSRANQKEGDGKDDTCSNKTAPALHHLFLYQDPPLSHPLPLIGSSQLWAKHFQYLYPSTQILVVTSTLYAYEDGTASRFRKVGTKSSYYPKNAIRHWETIFFITGGQHNIRAVINLLTGDLFNDCFCNSDYKPIWSKKGRFVYNEVEKNWKKSFIG